MRGDHEGVAVLALGLRQAHRALNQGTNHKDCLVEVGKGEEDPDEKVEEEDEHHHHELSEDDLYLGNAFEGFEEKIKKMK